MNNVFDIKRFGRYLTYDLNNAWNNFGISTLVLGLMPLILLFFNTLFSLVFTGQVQQLHPAAKGSILACAFIIVAISGPIKLYGHLTERRSGSDWLMLPASSFEKFLSMMVMLCIILPVAALGLFAVCDLLLSWIVPIYGDSIVRQISGGLHEIVVGEGIDFAIFTPGGAVAGTWMNWMICVLPFALGALCFKKGKAAKTILCIFGLNMLLSFVFVMLFKGINMESFEAFFENLTEDRLGFWANFLINAFYFVVVGGLLTALYCRVRTIKH